MSDPTFENVRRRLHEMGLTDNEALHDAELLRDWDRSNPDQRPELYGKGSEAKLRTAANEIFSQYKAKASKLAYGAGPLGALIFDKINGDNYARIQKAINDDPIGNWKLLRNLDATTKTQMQILSGEANEEGALMNNFFANTAAKFGGTIKNVDTTAGNVIGLAENLSKDLSDLTDPSGPGPLIVIAGALAAAIILAKM